MHNSVLFPPPPQTTSGLGTCLGSRMGAKLVYPPFNVLLADESPSQEKDQAHTSGCIRTASALSLCLEGLCLSSTLLFPSAQLVF